MKREQTDRIIEDLSRKMVLLVGPRQVGKTFLAKSIAKQFARSVYLNYDHIEDRKIIQEQTWIESNELIIFDELHKMPEWKNYLKGIYDTKPETMRILVTGSARLDAFISMGDALAGRCYLHRLMPLSVSELKQLHQPIELEDLLQKGGFPEPYLAENKIQANRWRMQYINSILATDVFDFDKVQNIHALRTVFELLRTKVGAPVSYQSLSEDVAVSPHTIKKYIQILEALYIIFPITPFSKNIARSLLKEPKIYFFDTGLVKGDEGARLENMVAVCLLKHVYAKVDYFAESYTLHYLKTKEKLEVDFALVKDNIIEKIIEVKISDKEISKALYSFYKKYNLPALQIVKNLRQERLVDGIEVRKVISFLSELML